MPQVLSDIVDVYVFRRLNARVQFLLLQRRPDVTMPQTWQGFHAQIDPGESTLEAASRAVQEMAGLTVSGVFSADYVNQFYDDYRDALVLAPVIAVNVSPQAPVSLGDDFRDCAWLDRDEATIRLPFSGQRWAVRHIDELMSIGEREAELYRLQMPESPAPKSPTPLESSQEPEPSSSIAIGETYDEVAKPSDPTSNDFPILNVASIFTPRRRTGAEPAARVQTEEPPSEIRLETVDPQDPTTPPFGPDEASDSDPVDEQADTPEETATRSE